MSRIKEFLKLGLVVGVVAGITALPWILNFESFSDGIGLTTERSPLWQMGVLWGGHIAITAIAVILNYKFQITNFKFLSSRPKSDHKVEDEVERSLSTVNLPAKGIPRLRSE